jgi:Flp pilus assembly CpaE family ATPase
MTVLWVTKPANANRYSVILGKGIRAVNSSRALLEAVTQNPAEQLVVIGSDVPFTDAVAATFELQNIRPSLGVVLVSERPDAATYSKAMSGGVRFVVIEGDAAELLAATENSLAISARLQAAPSEPVTQKRGRLVMVFSAKGGCGKTTVSTNLAVALAADESKRVCLVDLDLQFGDVAIALNLEPRRTIVDALPLAENLTGQNLGKVLTKHRANLQVLLAPIDPAHIESITPALVGGLLNALKQEFDYVVVDTPPAITEVIIEAIDLADDCVLLTTLDAPSIKNLRLAMATLIGLEVPREKWRVVANQCAPDSGISVPELERAIGMPAAIAIPESRLVAQSVNLGKAAVELNPLDPASVALQLLARKLEANFTGDKPRSFVSYLRPILNAKWVVNR